MAKNQTSKTKQNKAKTPIHILRGAKYYQMSHANQGN